MQTVEAAGLPIGDDHPTRIMGVLNVSRESPYDPSVFDDPGDAAAYVDDELVREGADIVDVGLESANKRFEVLTAEQELDRLDTAVEAIRSVGGDAVFSIETRYAEVADAALKRGFDMVNDICGFADPEMPTVCREYDVAVTKMASPPDLRRPGAIEETPWAERRSPDWAARADYVDQVYAALTQNGITDKTLVDPAFGGWSESKTLDDDRETFRRLGEFRGLGRPILVSINRKNFLRDLVGRSTERALSASLAATSMAIERGASVVRTHDVAETVDAARIGDAFTSDRLCDETLGVEELPITTPKEAARHADRAGGTIDPDSTVLRAFELSDLADTSRRSLASAAAEADVQVVDGSSVLLFGTPSSIRRFSRSTDGTERVTELLNVIADWCE